MTRVVVEQSLFPWLCGLLLLSFVLGTGTTTAAAGEPSLADQAVTARYKALGIDHRQEIDV